MGRHTAALTALLSGVGGLLLLIAQAPACLWAVWLARPCGPQPPVPGPLASASPLVLVQAPLVLVCVRLPVLAPAPTPVVRSTAQVVAEP